MTAEPPTSGPGGETDLVLLTLALGNRLDRVGKKVEEHANQTGGIAPDRRNLVVLLSPGAPGAGSRWR